MNRFLCLISTVAVVSSCATAAPTLTESEAIALANAAAESEGIKLTNYFTPEAKHKSSTPNQWLVSYRYRESVPGGWFFVVVDEKTKTTDITLGE